MSDRKQPLRIAIFTETFLPKIDGIVRVLEVCLRGLEELGHEVILFGPPGSDPMVHSARIFHLGGPPLPGYPELRINIPRPFIKKELDAFKPDIIHAAHPTFVGPPGIRYARRNDIPLLCSYHTEVPAYMRFYGYPWMVRPMWAFTRWLHNKADYNLGPSTYVRDELTAQGIHTSNWWIRGIDTEFFTPGPVNPDLRNRMTDGNPDAFLIGYVGRLAPEKGLFNIRDNLFPMDNARLVFVGDGPSNKKLRKYYDGTPTTFTGYLTGQDLIDAYRSLDLFLFPSTTETFGLVPLEALACGIPVVAARAGGVTDTIRHEENGLFFEPDRPQDMRGLVERMRNNPEERAQFAQTGLQYAKTRPWRDMVTDLVDHYYATIAIHEERTGNR